MSRTKRNYRIKTFEKLEGLGLSNEKEIPFSVKDVLNIIEMQEGIKKDGLVAYLFGSKKE